MLTHMVNAMLRHGGGGLLTTGNVLNRIPNGNIETTPYED
jgi:hypothetical protein